jgi:hypothetical protein
MPIEKRLLVPDRVRRPPREGFSWVDRAFLRDHAPSLERDAILLYLFLAAVSDKHGLSFWSDTSVCSRLGLPLQALLEARHALVRRDLIAHLPPLTQVLSLPPLRVERAGGEVERLGDILRRLSEGRRSP